MQRVSDFFHCAHLVLRMWFFGQVHVSIASTAHNYLFFFWIDCVLCLCRNRILFLFVIALWHPSTLEKNLGRNCRSDANPLRKNIINCDNIYNYKCFAGKRHNMKTWQSKCYKNDTFFLEKIRIYHEPFYSLVLLGVSLFCLFVKRDRFCETLSLLDLTRKKNLSHKLVLHYWLYHRFFLVNRKCFSLWFFSNEPFASGRVTTWGLCADQRAIEKQPAICQGHKTADIPTEPRGHLENIFPIDHRIYLCFPKRNALKTRALTIWHL